MPTLVQRLCTEGLSRPHGFEPLRVEGRIPDHLRGTLYRTGPGKFDALGTRYKHLFEADGAVTAVRIDGGRVEGACRMIRSRELLEEASAGEALYGSAASWWRRMVNVHRGRIKNTGNTNIFCYQQNLYALMEAAKPTLIDRDTLGVRGVSSLGGVVRGPMSAHPHRVPSRNAIYNFGVRYGRNTSIETYKLPDEGPAVHLSSLDLSAPSMVHDFITTENHLVFLVPPAVVNVPRMLLQVGSFADIWQWKPERGTEVVIVPIDHPDRPIRFHTEAFYQWHFANAFEEDGRLFVDLLHYSDFDSFDAIGRLEHGSERGGTYRRATIDPKKERLHLEMISDVPADFPRVLPSDDTRRSRCSWMVTEEETQRLIALDTETGKLRSHRFEDHERASEAVVIGTEDAALALTLVYDGQRHRTNLSIFDAHGLAAGPVARAWFDHHIPITFHGSWVPA